MIQLKHILVPLDGSSLAEKAIKPALILAAASSAKVTLLRVVPTLQVMAPFAKLDLPLKGAQAQQLARANKYLRSARMVQPQNNVVINTVAISGRPARAIIAYAQEHDVDLLMFSSHGGSGIGRWRYGEVAMKLLLNAPCSTLVVRAEEEHQPLGFKRMLVPLDGSEEAESVLASTANLAKEMGTEVILLRVAAPIQAAVGADNARAQQENFKRQIQGYLESVRRQWAPVQKNITVQVESGPVAETILFHAKSQNADLIAISAHGASGSERALLGGKADKVLRGARRAVMIVRPEN